MKKIKLFLLLMIVAFQGHAQTVLHYKIADNITSKNSRIHTIRAYLAGSSENKKEIEAVVNDIVTKYFLKEANFHLLKIFLYPDKKTAENKAAQYNWICYYEKFEKEMARYEYKSATH